MIIRSALTTDAGAIAGIYNHYVLTSTITFEEEPVSEADMWSRIHGLQTAGLPWLIAESPTGVSGYAYASQWKTRSAYRFSVESTVYVAPGSTAAGVGSSLYDVLLARLREAGLHTVIGGIALPNEASTRLHEKFGFEKTAHFKEVGFKFGRWIDVGYWQRRL